MTKYAGIGLGLAAGLTLHARSTGSGLRVVRLDSCGSNRAYGESYDLPHALRAASRDYVRYLEGDKQPWKRRYMTGTSKVSSPVDGILTECGSMRGVMKRDEVVLEVCSFDDKLKVSASGSTFEEAYRALNMKSADFDKLYDEIRKRGRKK
jgi:hypothetical protein